MKYPHLFAKLYNTPLLVEPKKAEVIERIFRAYETNQGGQVVVVDGGQARAAEDGAGEPRPERIESASLVDLVRRPDKSYDMTSTGIAVIPIVGELVQRTGGMQPFSGMIPYAYIGRKLQAAVADPEVKAILLEIDSPGGEVNGCFELAQQVLEARAAKPVWSVANEMAYSAAYALACATSRLYVPKTGGVGSVGVIMLHVDQSKRDASQGLAYTYVYAGARKKDFTPHEPLSEEARNIAQDEVDRIYGIFVAHVAKARGLSPERVLATEAGLLDPDVALKAGFVDGVKTLAETVEAMESVLKPNLQFLYGKPGAGLAAPQPPEKETAMSETTTKPAATTDPAAPPQQPSAAPADAAKIAADAVAADRARQAAIVDSDEAKGRQTLAQHLAKETDMAPDAAKKLLAKSPVENGKAGGGNGDFRSEMSKIPNPKVGADVDDDPDHGKPRIDSAAIFESRRAPQGRE